MNPTALWKLTIDPRGKTDPDANAFEFCQGEGIVGIGWGFKNPPTRADEVVEAFRRERPGARLPAALRIIALRVKEHDHVWVYGGRSYYICRIDSPWKYEAGGEWDRNGIHNFREATWKRVRSSLVPGIIRRSMTMRGSAKIISEDAGWLNYSERLFQGAALDGPGQLGEDVQQLWQRLSHVPDRELFEVLDEDETEDVVGLLLQEKHGWRMIKSSTYRSQRDVECIYTRAGAKGSEQAVMQVKSGKVPLRREDFGHLASDGFAVYLFSTADTPYEGPRIEGVHCLTKGQVADFIRENLALLDPPTLWRLAERAAVSSPTA